METTRNENRVSDSVQGLVLSAGRTSTVYLASRLKQLYPDLFVLHEPAGSRLNYLRANMNHYLGKNNATVAAMFNDRYRATLKKHGNYIELNPFLCPLCADLHAYVSDLDIVHLIRHPATWAPSLIQHGASGIFSHFIRLIPFHTPVVNNSLKQHLNMSYLQRIMWRWAEYNRGIASLQNVARSYTLIHFEDLFDQRKDVSERAIHSLLHGLALPDTRLTEVLTDKNPRNTSRPDDRLRYSNWDEPDKAYLRDELSPLLKTFGYELESCAE
jgi:hypothetical protein